MGVWFYRGKVLYIFPNYHRFADTDHTGQLTKPVNFFCLAYTPLLFDFLTIAKVSLVTFLWGFWSFCSGKILWDKESYFWCGGSNSDEGVLEMSWKYTGIRPFSGRWDSKVFLKNFCLFS